MTDTTGVSTHLDDERLELLRRKLAERGLARTTDAPPVVAGERPRMSVGQHRMWFVQSVDPDSALLNICVSYRLSGDVDTARLHRAVDAVVARQPVLHTTYDADDAGDPHPVIRAELRPDWAEHDLAGLTDQARRLRLDVLAQRDFRRPFDLSKDSPLRVTVTRMADDELMLLITAHHIAWDDGSWAPFFADLTRAYTGPDDFADGGVLADLSADSTAIRPADLDYWRPLMADLPEPSSFPAPTARWCPPPGAPSAPSRGCRRTPSSGRPRSPARRARPRTWC